MSEKSYEMELTYIDSEALADLFDDGVLEPKDLDITDVVLALISEHEGMAQRWSQVDGYDYLVDLHERTAAFLSIFLTTDEED